jgi:ferredoxin
MSKIRVDEKECIGCGLCESMCGKVFEMRDGKAKVKDENSDEKCAKEAEEVCPTKAIKIE